MSLKEILQDEIKRKGSVSLNEIHMLAMSNGYKQSTAERALRKGRLANIIPNRNSKGHITGYSWKNKTVVSADFEDRFASLYAETESRKKEHEVRMGVLGF